MGRMTEFNNGGYIEPGGGLIGVVQGCEQVVGYVLTKAQLDELLRDTNGRATD